MMYDFLLCLSSRFGVVLHSNSALFFDFSACLESKINLIGTLGDKKKGISFFYIIYFVVNLSVNYFDLVFKKGIPLI